MKRASKVIGLVLRSHAALWESDSHGIATNRQEFTELWDSLSPTEQAQVRELSELLFAFRQRTEPVDIATLTEIGRAIIYLDDAKRKTDPDT